MTAVKLILLVVVCIAGYTQGSTQNLHPFFDRSYGDDGVFMGASLVFFTYLGWDAIGNAAEEVRRPTVVCLCVSKDTLARTARWQGWAGWESGVREAYLCALLRHVAGS